MSRFRNVSLPRIVLLGACLSLAACGKSGTEKQDRPARLLIGGVGDQRSPAWLPDGKGIVFSSNFEDQPGDLFLFAFDSQTSIQLTRHPYGENSPEVSPDGRFVVYHTDRSGDGDLYRLDLVTSEILRLTTNPQPDGYPSWSPDGKRIVFHSAGAGDPDLWLMDADGGEKLPLVMHVGVDSTPAWSPKGDFVAYLSEGRGNPDVWRVRVDNRKPLRLTKSSEAEFAPCWSPDASRIVYCRGPMEKDGHANLWIMDADGKNQRSLTERAEWDDYDPAYSPDGLRIAFESNRSGDFDIWVIDAPE